MHALLGSRDRGEMGIEAEFDRRNEWKHEWKRLTGLIAIALLLTAVIAYRAIAASSLHGRLSVPPLYDDVSYFLDAVRWMNAASGQSLLASLRDLLHHHAPFSTLVAAIGLSLFPGGYVGPYLVNTVFVFGFLLGIIWFTHERPFHQVATCLIITACVPALWHTVTEARPDLPWGLALATAIGAIIRRSVLHRNLGALTLLGAGCGLAVSIKPTAFPASFALLGSMFALRLLLDCLLTGGLRRSFRKAVARFFCFGVGLLAVTGLLMGPSLLSTISYIINVFVTQRDLWTSGESFWVGLQFFLVGSGGKAGLNFWLWVGLALMLLRLLLAAKAGRAELHNAIILLAAVVAAYTIPSVAEIKTFFFGATFYGIFIIAMVLNFCVLQSWIETCVSGRPLAANGRRLLQGAAGVLPLAAAVLLFIKMVVIGPISLSLWLNDQQQEDIRASTERVWKLVQETKPDRPGVLQVSFSSAYPVTAGTIQLYAAQAHVELGIHPELFHRTLDETEKAMLATDMLIVSSSIPHTLVGPRMGDELIRRLDDNKELCLLDSLTFADIRLRVYRHPC